jgi:ankyrin repeat protein
MTTVATYHHPVTTLDQAGRSELHCAAAEGRLADVRSLIRAGADVTVADNQGMTPPHLAAQGHHVAIARALLDAGAPVDATDQHGNTPLWKAVFASGGKGELITLLRRTGADPTLANHHGTSPLELARRIANHDVAQHFADITDQPDRDRSPEPPSRQGNP